MNLYDRVFGRLPARISRVGHWLRNGPAGSERSAGVLKLLVNGQERRDVSNISLPALQYTSPDTANARGIEICQRLIGAYQLALRATGAPTRLGDVWDAHFRQYHQELHTALERTSTAAVQAILGRMFIDPVTTGFALGRLTYEGCLLDPQPAQLDWHDKAISLGLSLGTVRSQCPEQGEYGDLLELDSKSLLEDVMRQTGSDAPAQCGAIFGVNSGGKIYPVNYLLHIATADRIRTLLETLGGPSACLEIGGGVGFLAHAATAVGVRRFSIIDLPIANVLQGYYLLNSTFSDRVALYGEAPAAGDGVIEILPTTCIGELNGQPFGIAVNQDSIPEMDASVALGYLRRLPDLANYFLSINQEAQTIVDGAFKQSWTHQLCQDASIMKIVYRSPYWMRKGYVEELYSLRSTRSV
jgi:hypothetical protein